MKGKSKYLFTGIMSATLVFSGCYSENEKIDPKALLVTAIDRMDSVNKYECTRKSTIEMTTTEGDHSLITVDEMIDADKEASEIFKVMTDVEMTMGEETQEYEIEEYLQDNNGAYELFVKNDDQWEKDLLTMDVVQDIVLKPEAIVRSCMKQAQTIEMGDKEEIEGVVCNEVIITLNKEATELVAGQLMGLNNIGLESEDILGVSEDLDDAGEMKVSIYLDQEKGELIGTRWHVDQIAENIILRAQGMDRTQIDTFTFMLETSYAKMPEEVEVSIPDEAKMAHINEEK